jgi:hypothetical protein
MMRFWQKVGSRLIALGAIVLCATLAMSAERTDSYLVTDAPQPPPNMVSSGVGVSGQTDIQFLAQQPGAPLAAPPATAPQRTTPAPRTAPIVPQDDNALAQVTPPNLNTTARSPGYSLASTTNMIGDTLGMGYFFLVEGAGKSQLAGNIPVGNGTIKISENCSPLPVDRVFFDFNHFENALVTANGDTISLNRYTVGVEKTFLDGFGSVEFKMPWDAGLAATQNVDLSTPDNQGTFFGAMPITSKFLLYQNSYWATSAGVAVGLPTLPDVGMRSTSNNITVFDDSTHVAPFWGLLLTPNDRWFSITYLQFDFDTSGDRVVGNGHDLGRLRDPTLMYIDSSIGYWLFYDQQGLRGNGYLTGISPILELHYTKTLNNAVGIEHFIQPQSNAINALNLTAGCFFKLGSSAGLTVAGVAPLRTSPADKQFDAEVLVQFNRWFY